ncbi:MULTISPECIES: YopX family protein [Bacillus]|uniref:YopX family protein n=1 Tax=Bacillus TaxID=1386 RepID=UPI0030104EE2
MILFRGKPIEDYGDTKWFYGNAIMNYEDNLAYIESPGQGFVPVEWESVGQYIGLKDTSDEKKMVFAGDVVVGKRQSHWHGGYDNVKGVVCFSDTNFGFEVNGVGGGDLHSIESIEVIGNIYDNKDLLDNEYNK